MYHTKGRFIETFAARELTVPDGIKKVDSLERYALRRGAGLELRNRRPDRKRNLVV